MIYQVITGDLVDSVSFSASKREEIRDILKGVEEKSTSKFDYFVRGDGLQILSQSNALKEAVYLKSLLHAKLGIKLRLSIGIGDIQNLTERLSDSVGEAFTLSGQQLDGMKKSNKLIAVKCNNEFMNGEWQIHAQTLDYLENERTQNQSEVIVGLLESKTQSQLAEEIGISQPSVNQRVKSSGWALTEVIINRYVNFIDKIKS